MDLSIMSQLNNKVIYELADSLLRRFIKCFEKEMNFFFHREISDIKPNIFNFFHVPYIYIYMLFVSSNAFYSTHIKS